MTKPTSSQSTSSNPWDALLASATRTRPPSAQTSTDTSLKGGYTILLQHSMTPKSQRQWALESTIANVDTTTSSSNSSSSAGVSSKFTSLSIQNTHHANRHTSSSRRAGGDWYGISGPFLTRQAFHDLCKKCHGRVVLVSVSGTSGVWDADDGEDYDHANIVDDGDVYNNQQSSGEDGNVCNALSSFRRNGACVDLSSNPFGWNDENDALNTSSSSSSSTTATLNNLQSIATAIRQAASNIISSDETQQQPIPIIFDSLTPLLHIHGAERITVLFKSLGRTTSFPSFDKSKTTSLSVLSPIIAPVLYESMSLSDHRTLEDCADAMVSLNLMDSTINNTSSNFAVEGKDDNSIVVVSGVMDLVRRGGGGANSGLGGKLMRHCVPVHISRSLSITGDLRDGCYWIIDGGDNDNETSEGNGDATNKKGKKSNTIAPSVSSEGEMGQSQMESDPKSSSRPKIYLEDDDPDFQDYDEDDDLDL